MTHTMLDDAQMARLAGGTLAPFAPGPEIPPHGLLNTVRDGQTDLPPNGKSGRLIFVGPCPNPDPNG